MILHLALSVLAGLARSEGIPAEFHANPDAFWGRTFECGDSAEHFELVVGVSNIQSAKARVDAILAPVRRTDGSQGGYAVNFDDGKFRGTKIQSYVQIQSCERTVKTLLEMGELVSFSRKRGPVEGAIKSIDERVELLEWELTVGGVDLFKLPVARFFLTSKLAALRKTRAACELAAGRGKVSVSVVGPPIRKKE